LYAKQFEKWLFGSVAMCAGFMLEYELISVTTQIKPHKQHRDEVGCHIHAQFPPTSVAQCTPYIY